MSPPPFQPGINTVIEERAVIRNLNADGAALVIGDSTLVGVGAVVEGSAVGPGTVIGAKAVVPPGIHIGRGCVIGPAVAVPPSAAVPDGTVMCLMSADVPSSRRVLDAPAEPGAGAGSGAGAGGAVDDAAPPTRARAVRLLVHTQPRQYERNVASTDEYAAALKSRLN